MPGCTENGPEISPLAVNRLARPPFSAYCNKLPDTFNTTDLRVMERDRGPGAAVRNGSFTLLAPAVQRRSSCRRPEVPLNTRRGFDSLRVMDPDLRPNGSRLRPGSPTAAGAESPGALPGRSNAH